MTPASEKAKAKREATKAELARLNRELNIANVAISILANGETPEKTESYRDAESVYTLRAYRFDGAHGGIVITTFSHPGQSDSISVAYLDDLRRLDYGPGYAIQVYADQRDAVYRLWQARSESYREANEGRQSA